jgi:hypothetical protein
MRQWKTASCHRSRMIRSLTLKEDWIIGAMVVEMTGMA